MSTTATNQDKTSVAMEETTKVVYERKSFLGIIKWRSQVRVDTIGKDLIIDTLEKYDNIFLNGEKITNLEQKI